MKKSAKAKKAAEKGEGEKEEIVGRKTPVLEELGGVWFRGVTCIIQTAKETSK
ncbi:MAG: hypothetical protein U0X87_08965 [Anaerolineales bacterium]